MCSLLKNFIFSIIFVLIAYPLTAKEPFTPESGSGWQTKKSLTTQNSMAITAHPEATQAALSILKKGGSAVDAAIAAQLVLGLVEPQSSGLGGGAYALVLAQNTLTAWDGRERAPMSIKPNVFQEVSGNPLSFYKAAVGGQSVGTPGVVALIEKLHQIYGRLPWSDLFTPAITLAENGFALSPRLHKLLKEEEFLKNDVTAREYFYEASGQPKNMGTRLKNPEYADTLKLIQQNGKKAFYEGPVGEAVISASLLSKDDLKQYQVINRAPVCATYRQYKICSMPPSSSGGVAMLQMLKILEPFHPKNTPLLSAEFIHRFSEAQRLAFADRDLIADPEFVPVSTDALLNTTYLKHRSELITDKRLQTTITPGRPMPGILTIECPSTTQLTIADKWGQVITMTSSIEDVFGSRVWVKGFLLNNQLTDFSFLTHDHSELLPNRVQPGKRPRSSMSPTIVFNNEQFYAALGSPGGPHIIPYVAETLIAMLDYKLSPQEAVNLPHISLKKDKLVLEKLSAWPNNLTEALKTKGHETITFEELTSGLAVIVKDKNGYHSGVDPRREGSAMGE